MRHLPQGRPVDTLVVTFTGHDQVDISLPGFGEVLLRKAGLDLICVQKRANNAYQSMTRQAFTAAAGPIMARYSRVCFYGTSVGAYAALFFGRPHHADILAISPRNPIHPAYVELAGRKPHPRWKFEHEPLRAGENNARRVVAFHDPVQGGTAIAESDMRLMTDFVVPAFPQLENLASPHTGHPSTTALAEVHLLRPAVLGFFQGQPFDVQAFRRLKTGSPYYMLNLSRWLASKGKLRRAFAVAEAGVKRFSPSHHLAHHLQMQMNSLANQMKPGD